MQLASKVIVVQDENGQIDEVSELFGQFSLPKNEHAREHATYVCCAVCNIQQSHARTLDAGIERPFFFVLAQFRVGASSFFLY